MPSRGPGRLLPALVPALPFLWLGLFFALPFLIVFKISLSDAVVAQPPYAPVFELRRSLPASSPASTSRTSRSSPATASTSTRRSRRCASRPCRRFFCSPSAIRSPTRWRGRRARHAAASRRPRHPAVLDELPHPHLRLDRILKPEGLLNQVLWGSDLVSEPVEILNTEPPSISASSTPICRSWCCRSMPRSKRSIDLADRGGARPRLRRPGAPSGRSRCPLSCPASSPARCCASSRRSASSSSRISSAARRP